MLSAKQEDTLTKSYQETFDVLLNVVMDQSPDNQLEYNYAEQMGLVSHVVALKCVVLNQMSDIIKLLNREEADRAADVYDWLLQQLSKARQTACRSVRTALKILPTNVDIATKLCA